MRRSLICLWIAMVGLVGCGEEVEEAIGGTELNCDNTEAFQPCGGDLVGAWSVTSTCSESIITEALIEACPEADFEFEFGPAGTMRFNPDNTLASSLSVRVRGRLTIPKTCLPDLMDDTGVPPEACNQIDGPDALPICVDRGESCLCSGSDTSTILSGRLWTVNEGVVTLTDDQGDPGRAFDYCVQGRLLTLRWTEAIQGGTGVFHMRLLKP